MKKCLNFRLNFDREEEYLNFFRKKHHSIYAMSLIECMIYQLAHRSFYVQWNDHVCGRSRIVLLSKSFPVSRRRYGQTRHEREPVLSPCYRYRAELWMGGIAVLRLLNSGGTSFITYKRAFRYEIGKKRNNAAIAQR